MAEINGFIWGALAMACFVACLFFWRFWRLGRDRLFVYFALAFAVFGLHWGALGIMQPATDTRHYFYVLRLIAFVLIALGIVDKNRHARLG